MKLHSSLRILSIICYLFIFLQGMMIPLPFILVLASGITDDEPNKRLLVLLADLGLIFLAILSFKKKSNLTIALECIIYFMLLSPLVWTLANFPISMFGYALFFVPFGGFVILYPLSLLFSCLDYRHKKLQSSDETLSSE
jgi:hypothetical protein